MADSSQTILIVDDDPVIRVLLSDYLSSLGYKVESAETGIQCLEKISEVPPTAILLDFQMPVMNGLEVLKAIRKDPKLSKIVVMVLSANNDTPKLFQQENVSADRFILKPFEMQTIRDALTQLSVK